MSNAIVIQNGDKQVSISQEAKTVSQVLKDFCDDQGDSLFDISSCSFSRFTQKSDLEKMKMHLDNILLKIDIQQNCIAESLEDNIKQIMFADFFDMKLLAQSEMRALAQKFVT